MGRNRSNVPKRVFRRKRNSTPLNLKEEVGRKSRLPHFEASLGIVGLAGSGRKTLAFRFGNMHRGTIEDGDVPVQYFYLSTHPLFCLSHSHTIRLISYIIEPPAELRHYDPPLYWAKWNDFCCLIFLFDVANPASFLEVSLKLTNYRQQNFRVPKWFLVGNKNDRRAEPRNLEGPEHLNQRPVSVATAEMEAIHLHGSYIEVSAKENTNVRILLQHIKDCGIATLT